MAKHTGSPCFCLSLSLSTSLPRYLFLSAGLRGHAVTLRHSARPTTPCCYGVAGFGNSMTAVLNYMVCSQPLSCEPLPEHHNTPNVPRPRAPMAFVRGSQFQAFR